jgi:mono/diheme cytochrome c family protein
MPPRTPIHTPRAALPLALALTLAGAGALAQAPAAAASGSAATPMSRGQALYSTHCIACHNTQVHWRDNKLATDWDSLKALVRRWQATAALAWGEADVVEVARYLNDSIYRHPQTSDLVGLLAAPR